VSQASILSFPRKWECTFLISLPAYPVAINNKQHPPSSAFPEKQRPEIQNAFSIAKTAFYTTRFQSANQKIQKNLKIFGFWLIFLALPS
jgi:hypothetical protein